MKVTIHAEGSASQIASQLSEAAAVYLSAKGVGEKPVKRSERKEAEEAEETPPETDDSGFGEAEEAEEAEAAAPTLDDVIEACQSHAKRVGGREKTQAILLKVFKVKKPQELKSKQFADVIKALSGKK